MSCNENNGIRGILRVIVALQDNAEEACETINTCDKPFLGPSEHKRCFNTRPIMLFNDDGRPWEMPFDLDEHREEDDDEGEHKKFKLSPVFRVEKVDDNTATCRVLAPDKDFDHFRSTNSFFVVNIGCLCGIKCLPDTFIELC